MENLIGQKFNKLLVIGNSQIDKKKVICQCDCGKIKEINRYNLKSGLVRSCGCLHKEKVSTNLIGKNFGYLTVLEDTKKRDYNRNIIWKCQCNCGNICEIPTTRLQSGHTSSCGCFKSSKGEEKIKNILINNNIPFITQKTFKDLKIHKHLYFDFFINNQYLLEYDGEQHFKQVDNFSQTLEKQKKYDSFKNQWCKKNKIPLIRIPYTHLNNICLEDLLLETSKFIWKEDN